MAVVVQINTQAAPLSAVGGVMHAIGRRAEAVGIDCRIVAGYGKWAHSHLVLEGKMRYAAYALRHRRFGDDGFIPGTPTRRLLSFVEDVRPDIVHLHNMHGYYLDMPALTEWLLRTGTPVVATMHDLWWLTGRCASPGDCPANVDGCSGCENCPSPSYYPGVWSNVAPRYKANYLSPLNAAIVVPSESTAAAVRRSVLAHLPIMVIGNGVDKDTFMPEGERGMTLGSVNLLAVSNNWNPLKNAEALQQLAQAMPSDWHLTVVGEGCSVRGNNVTRLKSVKSRDELALLYRGAHVLLSPSLSETFGMTVAEANACGVPAIVNSEASPSIAPVRQNVMAVPFSRTADVISAIHRVKAGKANPDLVRSTVDMADDYIRLYRQILDAH